MRVRSAAALGAVIRDRRKFLKLDQAGLARRIGATRQWVIAIEKGKNSAELGLVLRALAALELEIDVAATGVTAPPKPRRGRPPGPAIDIDAIVAAARKRGHGGR